MTTDPVELRRRAAVLYRESRESRDPALASALMLRSLRMTAEAGRMTTGELSGTVGHDVAERMVDGREAA